MSEVNNNTEYTIDAKGKRLGRVATEAASVLIGKGSPSFARNIVPATHVRIINARLLDITEKKAEQETYARYSGYPGGLKVETLGQLSLRRGYGEALKRSISGMLPKNKLRSVRLKNLHISE